MPIRAMRAVIPEWDPAFDDPIEPAALRTLDVPVLLLCGAATTAAATASAERRAPQAEAGMTPIASSTSSTPPSRIR